VVAGGVESMSRVPLGAGRDLGRPFGPRARQRYQSELRDGDFPNEDFNQGVGAELIAQRWALTRQRLDEFSARSHELAASAIDAGAFDTQLALLPDKPDFSADEGLRRDTSAETLAGLKPAFQSDGVIHAGNSSQISDGASATLICSAAKARDLGLTPIARYHAGVVAGSDPVQMLTGPIPATEKLLRKTGLNISDIGVFEVNEAFACVPLAWQESFGVPEERLNPLGGAIAVGHPLGASGTVLMARMIHHMRDRGIRYGLQTMCEGGGTANATIVELI
jgi:acetyl-CoA acyltransferase